MWWALGLEAQAWLSLSQLSDHKEIIEASVTSIYSPEKWEPRLFKENKKELIMWQHFENLWSNRYFTSIVVVIRGFEYNFKAHKNV